MALHEPLEFYILDWKEFLHTCRTPQGEESQCVKSEEGLAATSPCSPIFGSFLEDYQTYFFVMPGTELRVL